VLEETNERVQFDLRQNINMINELRWNMENIRTLAEQRKFLIDSTFGKMLEQFEMM
jgi:hypothetical protein